MGVRRIGPKEIEGVCVIRTLIVTVSNSPSFPRTILGYR